MIVNAMVSYAVCYDIKKKAKRVLSLQVKHLQTIYLLHDFILQFFLRFKEVSMLPSRQNDHTNEKNSDLKLLAFKKFDAKRALT